MIGGSSAINAMIYMRGQAADYDGWRQLGLDGWGWDDVLPYFLQARGPRRAAERASTAAAANGGSSTRACAGTSSTPSATPRRRPASRKIDDFNTGDNEGSSYFQVNQKRGRRWSAARGFLKPVLTRPNLRARDRRRMVERVVVEGGRAAGVAFAQGGRALHRAGRGRGHPRRRRGRLAAAPRALRHRRRRAPARARHRGRRTMRPASARTCRTTCSSGRSTRSRACARSTATTPSSGGAAVMGARIRAPAARGPLTMAPSQLGAFARSSPDYATANLEFHFQPLSLDKWGEGLHPFGAFTASVCNLRPTSRGSVHVDEPDAAAPPAIQPNYLVDRGGPAGRGRCDPPRPAGSSAQAPLAPLPAAGIQARRASRLRRRAGARRRARSAPRSSIRSARRRWAPTATRWRCSTSACGCAASSGLRVDRRLGHAAHHLRQHQFADHDDRREGRRRWSCEDAKRVSRATRRRLPRLGRTARRVVGNVLIRCPHDRSAALHRRCPSTAASRPPPPACSAACAGSSPSSATSACRSSRWRAAGGRT